jgi:hypothetical protein
VTNLIVGDFNGDGKDDFIRQEKGDWDNDDYRTAELYLANANGAFTKSALTDSNSMKGDLTILIIGDFNGDGIDDFIRQEKGDWDNDDVRTAELYFGRANGVFVKEFIPYSTTMKGDLTNLIIGDFDGDGNDDFIRQEKGDFSELFLTKTGFFSVSTISYSERMRGDYTNLIVGDYNGDGKDDFIRQEKGSWDDDNSYTAELYLANSNGNGTFIKSALTDSNSMKGDMTNLIVGDYNGDGKDDFIRQEKGSWDNDNVRTAEIYLASSNGDGTFIKIALTDSNSMKGDLTNLIIGDYNGDGIDDFIRQEKGSWDNDDIRTAELYLANSNGDGTFSKVALIDSSSMKGDLTNLITGDFDGDYVTDFIKQPLYSDTATVYMPNHNFDYIGLEVITLPNIDPVGKTCTEEIFDTNKSICWNDNISSIDENGNSVDFKIWSQNSPPDQSTSKHCDGPGNGQWLCYQRNIEINSNRRLLTEACGDNGQPACKDGFWSQYISFLWGDWSNKYHCSRDNMYIVNNNCYSRSATYIIRHGATDNGRNINTVGRDALTKAFGSSNEVQTKIPCPHASQEFEIHYLFDTDDPNSQRYTETKDIVEAALTSRCGNTVTSQKFIVDQLNGDNKYEPHKKLMDDIETNKDQTVRIFILGSFWLKGLTHPDGNNIQCSEQLCLFEKRKSFIKLWDETKEYFNCAYEVNTGKEATDFMYNYVYQLDKLNQCYSAYDIPRNEKNGQSNCPIFNNFCTVNGESIPSNHDELR